ncbi:hypothetical protein R2R70_22410, partial [Cobetia sp. SIMBA_158]
LTQYIIVQENSNDKYEDKELGIYFEGQFAVITVDEQNKLVDMYIGKGTNLQFKKQTLTTFYKNSAYMKM